jgi:hypothetical protein
MFTHRHLNNLNRANRRRRESSALRRLAEILMRNATTTDPKPEEPKSKKAKVTGNYAVTTSTPTVNPAYSYATQTIPINQPIPIQSQSQIPKPTLPAKAYTGTLPFCANCTYHHLISASCRLCTTCNRLGHFATNCRVNIHLNSTITPPTRGCYNCGDPDHFKRMCSKLQTTPAPQTNDDQDQPFVQRPGKAPEEAPVP